ncbi:MAG: MFS transporter [Methanolinea sp. SDB]|nr:MAG: MFS transporter [Methanolinea sp. SDB]
MTGRVPEPAGAESPATRRIVLLIAAVASFITPFDGSAVNIALPCIGANFSMDAVSLSWVSTAYLLSTAVLLVPFGKLGDIYGRKRVFQIGITVFTAASFFISLSTGSVMIIVLRAVQGMGSAMIFGTSLAMLTSVYPPGIRGKALGISIGAVYLGLSLGPFIGGYLAGLLGWRSIFYVNIPLGIAVILVTVLKLKGEWKEQRREAFDLLGSVLYGAALVLGMYGLSILPSYPGFAFILAGIVLAGLFARYELRIENPVLNISLFTKNRVFAFSNLAALINYSATYAVTFLFSLYLQITRGFSPVTAGTVLVIQPVVQAVLAPLAGRLSDRIEPGIVASAGMAVTTIGLVPFIFLQETTGLYSIAASLVLLGVGFGLFSSPNTNAIMSSVEKRYLGIASGMVGTMRLLGQMFSMGVAMTIFAVLIGRVAISVENLPEFMQSLRVAFTIFSFLCCAGVFASLVRGRLRAPKNG